MARLRLKPFVLMSGGPAGKRTAFLGNSRALTSSDLSLVSPVRIAVTGSIVGLGDEGERSALDADWLVLILSASFSAIVRIVREFWSLAFLRLAVLAVLRAD